VRVSRAVALPYGDALNASIRHLKQFVTSDSETLRSLEAGIGNRIRPCFFGDSTNNILLRIVMMKNWSLFTFGHGSAKPPQPAKSSYLRFRHPMNDPSFNFMSMDFAILNHLPITRYHTSFPLADCSIGYSTGLVRLDGTSAWLAGLPSSSCFLPALFHWPWDDNISLVPDS
jgi:hypothetical protein